jgi:hypothetical protein
MMIPDEVVGGSRRQDDSYGRAVVGDREKWGSG